MTKSNVELFLDSGAFSAYTQGASIDLDEYIAFIKEHQSILSVYANLDVIGDPEATWKNQQYMEAAGLAPLPCYHYGEDPKWLKMYMARYDYIGLGGMAADANGVPLRTAVRAAWLDWVFTFVAKPDGTPRLKLHGYGMTSLPLMLRYPWYSVDSTSWVITGRLGSILVPKPWSKGPEGPWKVCVSMRSPSKGEAGQHFTTFPPQQRQAILHYIESLGYVMGKSSFEFRKADSELAEGERWNGKALPNGKREVEIVTEAGAANDYRVRDELNIHYFRTLEKQMPPWPWAFKLPDVKKGFGL